MAGILSIILFCLLQRWLFPVHATDGVALAFWNIALPLALGAGKALLNRKKKGATPGDAEFTAQSSADMARGGQAEQDYYDYLNNFDANEAATATAGAMSRNWLKKFGRETERLRGSQVGMGRVGTGPGYQDEDRYVDDFNDDVANAIAGLSLDTARLNLGARQDLGRYGERVTGRGLDLVATRRDQTLADRASKRAMYGDIAGALINAGGTYLGQRYGK